MRADIDGEAAHPMLDHHDAAAPPVLRLTVLHDPDCSLCRHLAGWLQEQPQLVPLEFVPVGSAEARRRYPQLDHDASLGEITVIGDTGEVWRGPHAFVTCLWALAEYRSLAQRLSTPAGLPLARAAAFAAGKYRAAKGAGRVGPGAEGASGPPGGTAGTAAGTAAAAAFDPATFDPAAFDPATLDPVAWPPGCVDGACSVPGQA